jgi:hypothetical protein
MYLVYHISVIQIQREHCGNGTAPNPYSSSSINFSTLCGFWLSQPGQLAHILDNKYQIYKKYTIYTNTIYKNELIAYNHILCGHKICAQHVMYEVQLL